MLYLYQYENPGGGHGHTTSRCRRPCFRDHRTLKPRSKFILKNLFLFDSKLNGQKLDFNIPLKIDQSFLLIKRF